MLDTMELEKRIARLEVEIAAVSRLEGKMDKLLDRMDKIVLLEQAQINHSGALDRAFISIKSLEESFKDHVKLDDDKHASINDIVSKGKGVWWIASIIWGAIGTALVSGLFLMSSEVLKIKTQIQVQERLLANHIESATARAAQK